MKPIINKHRLLVYAASYLTAHALWHDRTDQLNRRTLDRVALALGLRVSGLFVGEPKRNLSEDSLPALLAA